MSLILNDEIVERILIKKTCKSKTKSTKWTRIRFDKKKKPRMKFEKKNLKINPNKIKLQFDKIKEWGTNLKD
jgi:hypothetical protein